MTVVGHTSSAGMVVPVTKHISAATFTIVCVDSVPPVPGRAGMLRSSTDAAGSRKRRGFSRNEEVGDAKHCQGLRLAAGLGGPWQHVDLMPSYYSR